MKARESNGETRVLLAVWGDPAMYLVIPAACRMLSENGICVDLLYRKPNADVDVGGKVSLGSRTRAWPVGQGADGWRDKVAFGVFAAKAVAIAWRNKPVAVIGYDRLGVAVAFVATRLFPAAALIYHNFDFDRSAGSFGWVARQFRRLELFAARRAELTIFPAPGRAAEYKAMAGLIREPRSVLNCFPLAYSRPKTGELAKLLKEKGLSFDRHVIHLGSIGPFHGLDATIRSVAQWSGNWGLIIAGFPIGTYLEEMQKLVGTLGLDDKVVFLPSISQSLWDDCLHSAHLGICLYEPVNLSHVYMAGTSQKLNNYLVARIPSVVSGSPDFAEFVERYGTSKLADATNPSSIAQAVKSILSDPDEYAACCARVSRAFEAEFNFEKQFLPVLEELLSLGRRASRA